MYIYIYMYEYEVQPCTKYVTVESRHDITK